MSTMEKILREVWAIICILGFWAMVLYLIHYITGGFYR